jgi:membrane protease YdiL (CAAX protease family)
MAVEDGGTEVPQGPARLDPYPDPGTAGTDGGPPPRRRRGDAFAIMPWSRRDILVGAAILVSFAGLLHLLAAADQPGNAFTLRLALWLLMFGAMAVWPLHVLRHSGLLQRPRITRVLKESALAIPVAFCLLVVEGGIIFALGHLSEGAIDVGSSLAPLRNAPNEPRLYLLLIPAFTLGPIAEELLFRGLLYNAFRQRMAPILAVLLQATAFGLLHYFSPYRQFSELAIVFGCGVVFALVYEWRRTLWAPLALHCMQNFAFSGPLILLMILNTHSPAKTWQEAREPPAWFCEVLFPLERQPTAEAQRLYAIDMWGSKGLHLWKQGIQALSVVCVWFPADRDVCADAQLGIATVYRVYLRDPRRAIVECNDLSETFGDQPEICAQALSLKGWAYYDLGDYQASRESFQELDRSYSSMDWVPGEVAEALKMLEGK